MILTKLGNAVDVRQEKLSALEAKNKPTSEQLSGWSALSSAISNMLSQPPPKTAVVDPAIYVRELKGLRDMMSLIGEVFDLYPSVVTSFEKQHQGTQDRGSTITVEQLESLVPPLEEEEESRLLGPERQRKYVPRGLIRRPADDLKGSGPRSEELVLTYESEFLVKLARQAEDHLAPKWQNAVRRVHGWIPLPQKVVSSRVHLRWLAAIPNLTALATVILAILGFYMISAYLSSLGQHMPRHSPQEPHINRKAVETDGPVLGRYDAHVQPVQPVYRWEKPGSGQTTLGSHGSHHGQTVRTRPSRTAATVEPRYTIELHGI
ncbi:hypothetical protein BC939DRAFT_97564 [Gamsiella multidivaricata]|uniref:uncharacterized protein n=1 Tax=Gamsiella multidivaricata TaxID=101098 RepID=UPI00221F9B8B|nr:uncharacterized protein BC939DRAFT_97564 [Gamsiella multidivaricata]KAI7832192.1 hypothetical protein BC939DRAFT_97564 [Gamsiella multidivaricata]